MRAIILLQPQLPRTLTASITGYIVIITAAQQAISFTLGKETLHFLGRNVTLTRINPTEPIIASLLLK